MFAYILGHFEKLSLQQQLLTQMHLYSHLHFSSFFTVLQILRTVECLTKLFTFLFKQFLSLIVIIFQKFGYF